ncbi:hypothetical protein JG688_00016753 [Phytophthora aleatoria]|uniref:Uncharacterized protein n=1 Tax=Phytophthora aleatoria TaxID=2496075 RepID=A0A8J5M1U5_9STRA|nr:hypothetical protein JG688_00016753 [Phytophthora aleatoria]
MLAQEEIDSMNLQHGYCLESTAKHRTPKTNCFRRLIAKQSAGVALTRRTAQAYSLDEEDVFLDRIFLTKSKIAREGLRRKTKMPLY